MVCTHVSIKALLLRVQRGVLWRKLCGCLAGVKHELRTLSTSRAPRELAREGRWHCNHTLGKPPALFSSGLDSNSEWSKDYWNPEAGAWWSRSSDGDLIPTTGYKLGRPVNDCLLFTTVPTFIMRVCPTNCHHKNATYHSIPFMLGVAWRTPNVYWMPQQMIPRRFRVDTFSSPVRWISTSSLNNHKTKKARRHKEYLSRFASTEDGLVVSCPCLALPCLAFNKHLHMQVENKLIILNLEVPWRFD